MTGEALKAEMLIKAQCCIVLGVYDQRKYCRLGAHGSGERIDDQCRAEPLPTKPLIDRKPANQGSWDGRIARQTAGRFGRQIGERDAGRSKRVIGRNAAGLAERYETITYPAPDILCCAFPQIPVERFDAARKTGAIVAKVQSFGYRPFDHREAAMTLR
jgi:hypothetical protein